MTLLETTLKKHEDFSFSQRTCCCYFFLLLLFYQNLFLSTCAFEGKRVVCKLIRSTECMNSKQTQLSQKRVNSIKTRLFLRKYRNSRENKNLSNERTRGRERETSIDWLTIISLENDENKQLHIENSDSRRYRSAESQTKQLSRRQKHRYRIVIISRFLFVISFFANPSWCPQAKQEENPSLWSCKQDEKNFLENILIILLFDYLISGRRILGGSGGDMRRLWVFLDLMLTCNAGRYSLSTVSSSRTSMLSDLIIMMGHQYWGFSSLLYTKRCLIIKDRYKAGISCLKQIFFFFN